MGNEMTINPDGIPTVTHFDLEPFAALRAAWYTYAAHEAARPPTFTPGADTGVDRKALWAAWEAREKQLRAELLAAWTAAPVTQRERDIAENGVAMGQETCCCCSDPDGAEGAEAWCAATWGASS